MSQAKSTVLLVDDEARNLRLLEGILYHEPVDILKASNGADAISLVQGGQPDIVLLDIMLPGMNGFEVCRIIKSDPRTNMIPIVIVTALSHVSDRINALEAGADDFISKPVDATELTARVRSLLRIRKLASEKERIIQERLQFMASIAHDIRSPVTSILLNIELLQKQLEQGSDYKRRLDRMIASSKHINNLVAHVIDYYQIETGQFEMNPALCDLHEISETAVNIVRPIAEQGDIELDMTVADHYEFTGDANLITQILINLITNAIKYNRPDGRVQVRYHDLEHGTYTVPEGSYPPVLTLPNKGIVVEVIDTGIGIQEQNFDKVFREFDRLEQSGEGGFGLGLAVSQRFINMHGGQIWFDSKINEGSRFAFLIPNQSIS